ncbi:MAG: ParA family protein [Myxacorys chilensis ATA2-1-KO14]|jgi:chromosome partitioning protein|nr:ParA family protein [Myxacorys chilensis ATA2-1-KO14]
MILTVASFKGGVGKSTSAIHLAAYLQQKAPTLLIDGDVNRSVTNWATRGNPSFKVVDERQAAKYARSYEHIVIDTPARPSHEDLKALVDGCDLLIIPSSPDAFALDALMLTVDALVELDSDRYKILLTIIPPAPSKEGEKARVSLTQAGLPVFKTGIRRLIAFQRSALLGVPINEVDDPRAKQGWEDYQKVGKEILS